MTYNITTNIFTEKFFGNKDHKTFQCFYNVKILGPVKTICA